jgi:hypothetical protein
MTLECPAGLNGFDLTGLGNSNLGHLLEGTETDKTALPNGITGRGLTDVEPICVGSIPETL